MGRIKVSLGSLAIAVVGATIVGLGSTAEARSGLRFECRDELGRQDASATARFERDGARKKFSLEAEAARNTSFRAGDILVVEVKNIAVGQIVLRRTPTDFVGDLNFDTTAGRGDDAKPFPRNFPQNVGAGTVVEAGPFRCALQRR